MGAAALEPGQPDGGAVRRTRQRLAAHTPDTLVAEDAGARDPPMTVGDLSTLNPEVFDCTFVVTKPIIVHVRGGDLARPAVVPRVGRGEAKAKSLSRVSPRSEVLKGVPMGAVALELGQPDGGAVPRTGTALQHILQKFPMQQSRQ